MDVNRRNFLKGTAAGAAGTALAGGVLIGGAHADADAATQGSSGPVEETSYPFHGANQSGILTPGPSGKQAFTCVAAFDSMASDKAALADLLQTVTTQGAVPCRRRYPAQPRRQPAAVRQRRAGARHPGRRADRDTVGRVDAVRRPVRDRRR